MIVVDFWPGPALSRLDLPAVRAALAQPASGQPYKIGVTYPLSGPQGAWGQLLVPAIEIAVQHVNEAGGVNGRPLALVVEDSKGNPEGAISAMRKVVQVDGVQVIMTIFTNVVSAQMPLSQQFKVPLFSPVEAPGLVASSNHWAFAHSALLTRTLPLLEARWKKMGVKRLFAFYPNTADRGIWIGPRQRGGRAARRGLRRDAVQAGRHRFPRPRSRAPRRSIRTPF